MPHGLWAEADWPRPASVAGCSPAKSTFEPSVSFVRTVDWDPVWGLEKIDAEPSSLLWVKDKIRESKREKRSERHVVSIVDRLPRRPKSSAAAYPIGGSIEKKDRKKKEQKNGDAEEKLRRTEQAVKQWSMKEKAPRIPECALRYALPDKSMACKMGHEHRGARKLNNTRDSIAGHTYEDTFERLELTSQDGDRNAKRAQLSVYDAAKELAESNVSLAAVKDLLDRFQNPGNAIFTKEYVFTQHLYGTMCDYIRDLWVTTVNLSHELEFDSLEMLDEHTRVGLSRKFAQSPDENILSGWLKMVLDTLNSLQWDSVKSEFQKWIKTAQEQDTLLRDALDFIGEHMDSVLNLLTISRYAIEEALGTHMLVAANQLMTFHESMTKWTEHPDRPEHPPRSPQWRKGSNGSLVDLRLQQLLEIAQEEKERQRRNLELNQGLRNKMAEKTMDVKLSVPPIPAQRTKTVIVNAQGAPVHLAAPTATQEQRKSRASIAVSMKPLAHVSDIFGRCMDQCKTALETIEKSKKERDKLLMSAKLWRLGKRKEERMAKLRGQFQAIHQGKDVPHSPTKRAAHLKESPQPTVAQSETVESLAENVKAKWSLESFVSRTSLGDDDNMDEEVKQLNKRRQIECERLLRKRQDLHNKLNRFSVKVSLAGVWGSFLKMHAVEEMNTMQKVMRAGSRRPSQEELVSRQGSRRDLHSDRPTSAATLRSEVSHHELGGTSSKRMSRSGSKEVHVAEIDGLASIDQLLEACAQLETQGNEAEKELQKVCQPNKSMAAKVLRRFGSDVWEYTSEDDGEGPDVWFKINPRERVMNIVSNGVGKLVTKGALLLGREGEQQLKAFLMDLKGIGRSMEQEHDERLQSAAGFLNDKHAAWHFRVNVPFDMLLKRFQPTWKGLQDRIRLADEMEAALEITAEESSDEESYLPSDNPSECSEGVASRVSKGDAPVDAQNNEAVTKLWQAKFQSIQVESKLKRQMLLKTEAETQKLEKQADNLKKVMLRQIEVEAARARSWDAKNSVKDLARELEKVKQKVIHVRRFGLPQELTKKEPDLLQPRLSVVSSVSTVSVATPRLRYSTVSGSLRFDDSDEDSRFGDGHDFRQDSGAISDRSRLTRKSMFDMSPMKAPPMSAARMQKKINMNTDKLRLKIEKAQKAESVLKMRSQRRKEDFRRLLAVLKKLGYGDIDGLPKAREELEEKWDKEMGDIKSALVTVNKVLKHWRTRMEVRYEEIREKYGDEVLAAIKDTSRRSYKDGNKALFNAWKRSSLEAQMEETADGANRPTSARKTAVSTNSAAFNEAFDALATADPSRVKAMGGKSAMLRQIDKAIRQLTEKETEGKGQLGDGLPNSAEKEHLLVLQSFFLGKQTVTGRSQVATLGGGLHASRGSKGRIFRSALASTDVKTGLGEDVLSLLGETPIVGKAVKGHSLHRARRVLRGRSNSRKGSRKGTASSFPDLSLANHGKRGTVGVSPEPSEKNSDEDSDDGGLFKKARGSLFLYKSRQRKMSKPLINMSSFNTRWSADHEGVPTTKRQTVTFADAIELLHIRNRQLAARHENEHDDAHDDCKERLQMLRVFIDDTIDADEVDKKEKKLRFQERSEEIKPLKISKKNRLALPARSKPGKRSKDPSTSMLGLMDFKTPKHMTRRKTWMINHDVGQKESHEKDTLPADDSYELTVKAERCLLCSQRKEAVLNRLMLDPIDAARASIHSSMCSSRSSAQLSSLDDEEDNPWQEVACGQQGLQLLRACRERLLQEFGSFEKAFERATCVQGDGRHGSHKDEFMYFDAFDWLTGVVGFDEAERKFMFEHLKLVADLETDCEKIEKAQFAEILRSSVPLSNLVQLRIRLLHRFGRVASAFDASSAGGRALSPSAFCKMLEMVNVDASEARQLFAQIEIHNECAPEQGSQRKVTRRAVLKSFRLAEHLAAARKLCRHLYTVHGWHKASNEEDPLHIDGGGLVPPVPEDGNMEQLVTAYNTLVQLVDVRYINRRLNLEQLQTAVKSISLSREDVEWLFRLCSRDSKDGLVTIQEVAIRAMGGLGHRCKVLAMRVGQEATARGCNRCRAFTALAVKNAMGDDAAHQRLSLGVYSSTGEEFSIWDSAKGKPSTGAIQRRSKIPRGSGFKGNTSELDSGVEAGSEDNPSDVEDRCGTLKHKPYAPRSRSSSPIPRMRRDRPGAEMEPLGAAKRHWSWWLDLGVRSRVKKLRPREVRKSQRPGGNWSRGVPPPPRRIIITPDVADSVVVSECSDHEGENEASKRSTTTSKFPSLASNNEASHQSSPSPESALRKEEVDEQDGGSDSEGARLSVSGSEGGDIYIGSERKQSGINSITIDWESKVAARGERGERRSSRRSSSKSSGRKPSPRKTTRSSVSSPRRPESCTSRSSRDKFRTIERGNSLEVTSKEVDSKDPNEDESTKWRFKDNPERRGFQRRQGSLEYRSEFSESDGNSNAKESRSPTPTGAVRRFCESPEVKRHLTRLALFKGDVIELQTATQRIQDFRFRLLARFRTPAKAFEVLAGSKSTKLEVESLQTKVEKLLSFNPLDACRVVTLLSGFEEERDISYANYLQLMRFAMPVGSVLAFRTRLVQMFGRVDVAFREIGLFSNEYDIGTFEKPMLSAGITSADARRIFRVVDAVRPGGPCGHLMNIDFERAVDNAHILGWLEAFYARTIASAKGRTIFEILEENETTSEALRLANADALEKALALHGYPAEFVPATFAFLVKASAPKQATLDTLAHILQNAFGNSGVRKRSKERIKMQKQLTGNQPLLERSRTQAKKKLGVARPMIHMMTMGARSLNASSREASPEAQMPLTDVERLASAAAQAEAVREEALVNTRRLRRQVMLSFADYQQAYDIFHKKRPQEGIALDEWMEAMASFGFSDTHGWELIYGHMVNFQHMRWDPRCTEGRGVAIAVLASSLDQAAPCLTPLALRGVLQERCGTLQKAWANLTGGKEGVEELSLLSWKRALQNFGITGDDAGYLHAMLRAAPIAERNTDVKNLHLSRVAFMATMRGAESLTRLFELLDCLRKEHGPVSCAFEVNNYSTGPLQIGAFEEELAALLDTTVAETRTLFAYLDFYQDSLVSIDDLLDALTVMQATFLPNHRAQETTLAELPKPSEKRASNASEIHEGQSGEESLGELPIRSRSVLASPIEIDVTGRASSELTIATNSPMELVALHVKGGSSASGHNSIHRISTTLPDSDSESVEGDIRARQARPWTSMAVSGDGAQRPPTGRTRAASMMQHNLPRSEYLPHLDLAASRRACSIEASEDRTNIGGIRRFSNLSEWTPRLSDTTVTRFCLPGSSTPRNAAHRSASPHSLTSEIGFGMPPESPRAHQPELPALTEVMTVQHVGPLPLPKSQPRSKARAKTLGQKATLAASFRRTRTGA